MTITLNAFRAIASHSPDKFIYAEGDTLKASRSDTRHGAHPALVAHPRTLVEDAIRSRPQDFPFLTKYYLNAE